MRIRDFYIVHMIVLYRHPKVEVFYKNELVTFINW